MRVEIQLTARVPRRLVRGKSQRAHEIADAVADICHGVDNHLFGVAASVGVYRAHDDNVGTPCA